MLILLALRLGWLFRPIISTINCAQSLARGIRSGNLFGLCNIIFFHSIFPTSKYANARYIYKRSAWFKQNFNIVPGWPEVLDFFSVWKTWIIYQLKGFRKSAFQNTSFKCFPPVRCVLHCLWWLLLIHWMAPALHYQWRLQSFVSIISISISPLCQATAMELRLKRNISGELHI